MIAKANEYGFCLGTAMWAWTIQESTAKNLLDHWYEQGFRCVDTASNYPINKKPEDFRKAEKWLAEWIHSNSISDLKVMVKIGSIDNSGSPEHSLNPSFLSIAHQHYMDLFSEQFDCMMIHWDNREEQRQIEESIYSMSELCKEGQQLGLSGIKHPGSYKKVLAQLMEAPLLQAKHNPLQSHLDYYDEILHLCKPICYGLSGGGIKLTKEYNKASSASQRNIDKDQYTARLQQINDILQQFNREQENIRVHNMHQLGMLYAAMDQRVHGLLIGPSKTEQLKDAVSFLKTLEKHSDAFSILKKRLDD